MEKSENKDYVNILPQEATSFQICYTLFNEEYEEGVDFWGDEQYDLLDAYFEAGRILGEFGELSDGGAIIEIQIFDGKNLVFDWED